MWIWQQGVHDLSQSSPSLVFANCIELLHFGCKEYTQSDFGVDHLVMSMCRVFSCVVGRGCLLWAVCSLGKTLLAFALLILYPRPDLPVTPGVSWFPTFAFQSPIMKRTSFWVLVPEGLVGLHRTVQLQLLQGYWSGHRLRLLWYWLACLGSEQRSSVIFEIASKYCIWTLVDYDGYSISPKGFLPTVVDTMVIWVKFPHSSPS